MLCLPRGYPVRQHNEYVCHELYMSSYIALSDVLQRRPPLRWEKNKHCHGDTGSPVGCGRRSLSLCQGECHLLKKSLRCFLSSLLYRFSLKSLKEKICKLPLETKLYKEIFLWVSRYAYSVHTASVFHCRPCRSDQKSVLISAVHRGNELPDRFHRAGYKILSRAYPFN